MLPNIINGGSNLYRGSSVLPNIINGGQAYIGVVVCSLIL